MIIHYFELVLFNVLVKLAKHFEIKSESFQRHIHTLVWLSLCNIGLIQLFETKVVYPIVGQSTM